MQFEYYRTFFGDYRTAWQVTPSLHSDIISLTKALGCTFYAITAHLLRTAELPDADFILLQRETKQTHDVESFSQHHQYPPAPGPEFSTQFPWNWTHKQEQFSIPQEHLFLSPRYTLSIGLWHRNKTKQNGRRNNTKKKKSQRTLSTLRMSPGNQKNSLRVDSSHFEQSHNSSQLSNFPRIYGRENPSERLYFFR